MKICLALLALMSIAPFVWAADSKAIPETVSRDIFLKKSGGNGVGLTFDCNSQNSKSPYCLVQVSDTDNGIICYGLLSTEKVANPSLSCVSAPGIKAKAK